MNYAESTEKKCRDASRSDNSKFVEEAVEGWDFGLDALALTRFRHYLRGPRRAVHRIARHHLPVVEHALWECLPESIRAQFLSEAYQNYIFIHYIILV